MKLCAPSRQALDAAAVPPRSKPAVTATGDDFVACHVRDSRCRTGNRMQTCCGAFMLVYRIVFDGLSTMVRRLRA